MQVTESRKALIEDLKNGAKIMVTYEQNQKPIYELIGGGQKHSDAVVDRFVPLAMAEGMLEQSDAGLFPGCGQCFTIVR